MKKLYLLMLLLLCGAMAWAQSSPQTNNLSWQYNKIYNGKTQQEFESSGTLLSYPGNKIDWVQSETQTFSITGMSGNWTDASTNGTTQFTLQWGESYGTMTFTRDGSGLIAELSLTNPGRAASYFKFYLTTVTQP